MSSDPETAVDSDFTTIIIGMVGGDRREQEIARRAAATGAMVRCFGFPWPEEGIAGVVPSPSAAAALEGAHFGLLPIPGSTAEGALVAPAAQQKIVVDASFFLPMHPRAHVFLGIANERIKAAAAAAHVALHEYDSDVRLMLLRGPAVVEGMLKVLIENTDFTIQGAEIGIVGQGTIGALLTRTLLLLGARLNVFARNPIQRAAATAVGATSWPLELLSEIAPKLQIIVSLVPASVVGRPILERLPRGTLVVDVAAPPGGVDLASASELGLRAVWARGLGSRAPVSVGASQWIGLEERILAILASPSSPLK